MIKYSMEFPVAERSFWLPFCDMEFVLAHKVLEDNAYAEELRNREHGAVILDNSMHELGEPLSCADIHEAANRCHPDWVIPPDMLGRWAWNREQLMKMCALASHNYSKVAVVLCGETQGERANIIDLALSLGCRMICLPYREPRTQWFMEQFDNIFSNPKRCFTNVHLLGVSSLSELRAWANVSRDPQPARTVTFSMDTAKAYKWGMTGHDISEQSNLRSSPVGSADLLNVKETPDHRLRSIIQNIHTLKAVCQGR